MKREKPFLAACHPRSSSGLLPLVELHTAHPALLHTGGGAGCLALAGVPASQVKHDMKYIVCVTDKCPPEI